MKINHNRSTATPKRFWKGSICNLPLYSWTGCVQIIFWGQFALFPVPSFSTWNSWVVIWRFHIGWFPESNAPKIPETSRDMRSWSNSYRSIRLVWSHAEKPSIHIWLVVLFRALWKRMEFVSWDDDISNIWKNTQCSKPLYKYIYI